MTFFVTGILAQQYPEIVKQIHRDGHEIGCHYYYHDVISDTNKKNLSRNLDKAIEIISNLTGEKPAGFRAPFFGINENDYWAYEEISKRFKYDSSFKTSKPYSKVSSEMKRNNIHKLKEIYIYEDSLIFNSLKIRSGGTYFRLFSGKKIKRVLENAYNKGHTPLLYLHPYDITQNQDFRLSWKHLSSLNLGDKIYFAIRQYQWTGLGHKSIEKKLDFIFKFFEHKGPMKNLLDT